MSYPKLSNESYTTVSATGTITGIYDVYFVDATAGAVTLTLPGADDLLLGRSLTFKRIDSTANVVTIQRAGADTIDGATSVTMENTDIVVLLISGLTTWRSMRFGGAQGSTSFTTVSASAAITGAYDVYFVDATAGSVTLTLPLASSLDVGRSFSLKRTDSSFNTVTITRAGADTIDGATSVALVVTDVLTLMTTASTTWTAFRYEGSVGVMTVATVTTTSTVNGDADLYLITAGANITVSLPNSSTVAPYKKISFQRTDVANFSVTISRTFPDSLDVLGGSVLSTTTTASGSLSFVSVGGNLWRQIAPRPTYRSWILNADVPVTVTTNYDVWIAPTLAADRAYTLPLAGDAGYGKVLTFSNKSAANNMVLTRAGADVINAAAVTLNVAAATARSLISDGISVWSVV